MSPRLLVCYGICAVLFADVALAQQGGYGVAPSRQITKVRKQPIPTRLPPLKAPAQPAPVATPTAQDPSASSAQTIEGNAPVSQATPTPNVQANISVATASPKPTETTSKQGIGGVGGIGPVGNPYAAK